MKVTEQNMNSPFEKLLHGLIEGDDLGYFSVDKKCKEISFMVGDWNVTLKDNGKWEIC